MPILTFYTHLGYNNYSSNGVVLLTAKVAVTVGLVGGTGTAGYVSLVIGGFPRHNATSAGNIMRV